MFGKDCHDNDFFKNSQWSYDLIDDSFIYEDLPLFIK